MGIFIRAAKGASWVVRSKMNGFDNAILREVTEFAIKGPTPHAITSGALEDRVGIGLNAPQSQVMICGSRAMVHETQQALGLRSLKKIVRRDSGYITTESYW